MELGLDRESPRDVSPTPHPLYISFIPQLNSEQWHYYALSPPFTFLDSYSPAAYQRRFIGLHKARILARLLSFAIASCPLAIYFVTGQGSRLLQLPNSEGHLTFLEFLFLFMIPAGGCRPRRLFVFQGRPVATQ